MNHSSIVLILCAFLVHTMAKELAAGQNSDVHDSMDKLVDRLIDKLVHRALKAWPHNRANQDNTTLLSGTPSKARIKVEVVSDTV